MNIEIGGSKMKEYHKIQTVYKRDPETKFKTLLEGEYSLPEFEYLKNNNWEWTEKIDGTNIRIMFNHTNLVFGGKTDRAEIPNQLLGRLNEIFINQVELLKSIFPANPNEEGIVVYPEVCLYGEGYGAKIQSGGKYRSSQDFILFDIKIGHWWLKRWDIEVIANKLGIEVVPIIGTGTLLEMIEKTKEGFNSKWGNFLAEGIVARPEVELQARSGQRIITKIKHKDFRK